MQLKVDGVAVRMATCGVWLMQPGAQTTTLCFLAVSAGDLKVAIVMKAPKNFSDILHLWFDVNISQMFNLKYSNTKMLCC